MNTLHLCTHYGFGDYVICYGLVKELSKKYDNIVLFVKKHLSELHISNIKRLYSSIPNVHVNENSSLLYQDVLYLGWDKFFKAIDNGYNKPCAKYFYDLVGLPLNLMWDNFYFERDIKKEQEIYYDRLGLKDGEGYIFLHDDPSRDYVIKRKYVNPNFKIIRLTNYPDVSILDILYLIENANEVHLSNTGLVSFIDLMGIDHNNLNYHRYTRPAEFEQPILKLKWNIIDGRDNDN